MERSEREKKIVQLLRLIRNQHVRNRDRILAENCDDPELIQAALAAQIPRDREVYKLTKLLWQQPRDQWRAILSKQCNDPELIADAMEEARRFEDGEHPEGVTDEDIRRLLFETGDEQ